MRCPTCKENKVKSKVFRGPTQLTTGLVETFWDEDEQYHRHDGNVTTEEFTCSEGHTWSRESTGQCPVAGCTFPEEE